MALLLESDENIYIIFHETLSANRGLMVWAEETQNYPLCQPQRTSFVKIPTNFNQHRGSGSRGPLDSIGVKFDSIQKNGKSWSKDTRF